jgi:hypothetical protein
MLSVVARALVARGCVHSFVDDQATAIEPHRSDSSSN